MDAAKEAESGSRPPSSRRRRPLVLVSAAVVALLVVGLALGLGLGLGLRHGNDHDGDDDESPDPSPSPSSSSSSSSSPKWQPSVNATWQIVLDHPLALADGADATVQPSDADVFDIDLFMHQNATTVAALHRLGKRVVCYFSAGSYEPDRPDSGRFARGDLGAELDGWPGEYWLNVSSPTVRTIMARRIGIAADMGCDAVDPDNVDGYQNTNGLGLTRAAAVDFVRFLAAESAERGLAVGLKNAGDLVDDVLDVVHFSVNEQCAQYDECATFAPFVRAGKPVFHIEYPDGAQKGSVADAAREAACDASGSSGFSTVLKRMELDGWVEYCDGTTATTAVEDE